MRYVVGVLALAIALVAVPLCLSKSRTALPAADQGAFNRYSIDHALASDRPYVIVVLGDSTSRADGAWTYQVSRRIAEDYHRVVTVHDWSTESLSYSDTQTFGSGGPPVTVWNGSAGGQSAQYSLKWFSQMVPEPHDLTIINHTHNNPWHAVDGISQLVAKASAQSRPGGGVAVILQNPRTDSTNRAELEQQVIDQLRTTYGGSASSVVMVDVNAAFHEGDLNKLLMPDGVHPSKQGSQLWADTVISTFLIR